MLFYACSSQKYSVFRDPSHGKSISSSNTQYFRMRFCRLKLTPADHKSTLRMIFLLPCAAHNSSITLHAHASLFTWFHFSRRTLVLLLWAFERWCVQWLTTPVHYLFVLKQSISQMRASQRTLSLYTLSRGETTRQKKSIRRNYTPWQAVTQGSVRFAFNALLVLHWLLIVPIKIAKPACNGASIAEEKG